MISAEEEVSEVSEEEEGEELVDIRSVRLSYLEHFVQVTKTWVKVLEGASGINELNKLHVSAEREARGKRKGKASKRRGAK